MRTIRLLLQVFAARWKNSRNIGFFIVLIVFMISTFCYVKKQDKRIEEAGRITLGIAQEDTSEYANLLLRYFRENEEFLKNVELVEAKRQELLNAMQAGRLDAYLIIPENFAESMIRMEHLPIQAGISMKNPAKALIMRHVTEAYEAYVEAVEISCTALYRQMQKEGFSYEELQNANLDISLELIFTALGKDDFFKKRMVETEITQLSLKEHYTYSAVYFLLLFLFVPAGLRVLSLKEQGILSRLKTIQVSFAGVYIGLGLPGFLVSAVFLAVLCFVGGNPDGFLAALLLIIPWLVIFELLGYFCKDSNHYLFVCSILIVCLAVFGGSLIPEVYLPDSFQAVARFLPNRNFTFVMGGVLW